MFDLPIPLVIFGCFFCLAILEIIIVIIYYKKNKPGFVLVVRSRVKDKIVRRGGTVVFPVVQSYLYIPMDIFEIKTELGNIKVCIDDKDESILKAISKLTDFSIESMKAQISSAVKGVKNQENLNSILSEYGLKVIK